MPQAIDEDRLNSITKKVYSIYALNGMDGVSMDEISAEAKISKATLYHYFVSKEDIVRNMVAYMNGHLDSVVFGEAENIDEVVRDVQAFYLKSVLFAATSGTKFLSDLERRLPDAYGACMRSIASMQERFTKFYEKGRDKGFFRDLFCPFVMRQFDDMLSSLIDAAYIKKCGLTLSGALGAYFKMFLCQILTDGYTYVTELDDTYEFCDGLAGVLTEDFYIDGV